MPSNRRRRQQRRQFQLLIDAAAGSGAGVQSFDSLVLATSTANLKMLYPLAFDAKDTSASANHATAYSGVEFGGSPPTGLKYPYFGKFNGTASQIRIEGASHPLQAANWTVACWFRKTAAGIATVTSGTGDGFPTADPIVPLVTKGRGEAETSGLNMNWFLGLNKVSNGSTYKLAGDFEETTGPNHRIVGATTINDNQWYFGVFTYNGSVMKLYLNGVEDASVSTSSVADNGSTQKAGIGTAYTSGSVADGFFAGHIAGACMWNTALSATAVAALYAAGIASFRRNVTFTQDAADNTIVHGSSFANWTTDQVTKNPGNMIFTGSGNTIDPDAFISISGLQPDTEYWASILVSATSGTINPIRQLYVGFDSTVGFTDPLNMGNGDLTLSPTLGTRYYFKVKTTNTQGPHKLRLSVDNEFGNTGTWTVDDVRVYAIPERSSNKVACVGDRTGNFNATSASNVNKAILSTVADTKNIITGGDNADTTNDYPTCDQMIQTGCGTTNNSPTLTGPAGAFAQVLPGMGVTGTNIQASTTVLSVQSPTSLTLSLNATGTATNTMTFKSVTKVTIAARGGIILPVQGNHDYDGTRETEVDDYYGYNGYNAGKTYFSVLIGDFEFFVYDDNTNTEHAGLSTENGGGYGASAALNQDSIMGAYILKRMAESGAKWKIFCVHHPAYSSSSAGAGSAHARWDWVGLQVPLVLQAHLHGVERIAKDGIQYFTNAMGGGDHFNWTTKLAETVFRVESTAVSGYLKLYDSGTALVLEWYDTSNALLDRVKITRSES